MLRISVSVIVALAVVALLWVGFGGSSPQGSEGTGVAAGSSPAAAGAGSSTADPGARRPGEARGQEPGDRLALGEPVHRSATQRGGAAGASAARGGATGRDAPDGRSVPEPRDRGASPELPGSGSRAARSTIADDVAGVDPIADASPDGDGPALTDLQARAAQLAEEAGLVEPDELERRVERALKSESPPPEELAQAREEARQKELADEWVREQLARRHAGPDASPGEMRRARDMARTLASAQGPDWWERKLAESVE